MKNPILSVIIPVFNEEKNLPLLVEKFKELAKDRDVEFLLVEDTGSTDNTREEVKKLAKNILLLEGFL